MQFVPQAGREKGVGVGRGAAGGGGVGGNVNGDASASSSSYADGFVAPRELEVGHVFAVGRGSAGGAELAAEARTFGDVLELDVLEGDGEHEEFADTLLSLGALHWLMHQCPLADFVLRTSDSLALNLHFWLSTLHAVRTPFARTLSRSETYCTRSCSYTITSSVFGGDGFASMSDNLMINKAITAITIYPHCLIRTYIRVYE